MDLRKTNRTIGELPISEKKEQTSLRFATPAKTSETP